MKIDIQSIDKLIGAPYNPRKDLKPGDKEYDKLKQSIEHFGYVEPIIVNDRTGYVVGGHQRLKVLQDLGYTEVEVVHVDLDENNEKALNVALNKVSGDWDADKLEDLLRELNLAEDFDVELTGFDMGELDTLFSGAIEDAANKHEQISKEERKKHAGGLLKKFGGFAPFSILDADSKAWLDRKKQWIDMGIQSEVGRDAASINRQGDNLKKFGVKDKYIGYTSIFDPVICEIIYTWFCIKGGQIFDPFAGGSVRGVVASELGYSYTGIDLRLEQIEANRSNYEEISSNPAYNLANNNVDYEVKDPNWICDDSNNMDEHVNDNFADLIFTCPPYADLEIYSNDPRDLSNKKYDEFISLYKNILSKSVNKLKDNRFFVIVVGEVRDKDGIYYNFVGDTTNILKDCGLKYYNEIILKTPTGSLRLTCGRNFNAGRKIGKRHQNILVFFKGDPKTIKINFGDVVSESEDDSEVTSDGND